MRAIILAAGRGLRLQQAGGEQLPKCLLEFGGLSLLERHFRLLRAAGVDEVVLALGFRHDLVEAQLGPLTRLIRSEVLVNARFELGSVLTLHCAADALRRGGDVLVMDADVLYDARIATALAAGSRPVNRLLVDRDFEAGDEPVKVCVRNGRAIELRKQLAPGLQFDMIGESVGFFRFDSAGATRLADICAEYVDGGRGHLPHEEAVRDLIQEGDRSFEVTDITGSPWIEIDFPADVERAARQVLPSLEPLPGVNA